MYLYKYGADKNRLVKELSLISAQPRFYIQMPNGEQAPVFDYKTFPFEIFNGAPTHHKRGKTLDRVEYLDIVATFDIETTTILDTEDPYGFMYQWQYCIEDYVFMGCTWEQFQEFQQIVSKALNLKLYKSTETNAIQGRGLVTYTHNYSYEFQYSQFFIGKIVSSMVTDKYCPLLIYSDLGFAYRCSYRLTYKSLEAFTKGFPHAKLAGDLDYNKIRVPHIEDPKNGLTDTELAYCYNDVKGLAEALRDRLDKDKYNIASIPLTSTGYVRKDCQISMRKSPKNRKRFIETKLDAHLYRLCRYAFRGGNTHANSRFVGKIVPNVKTRDLVSCYPSQMLISNHFPVGKFYPMKNPERLLNHIEQITLQYCLLVTIKLWNLKYIGKCGVPYIPRAKTFLRIADKDNIIEDNGRIFSAPFAELTITDIDLKYILRDYSYSRIEVVECWYSHAGKLPNDLRKVVLEYYKAKTMLKHAKTQEDEYEYNRAKEKLNSSYGMMVQRIDHIEYKYENGEYSIISNSLEDMLDKFYNSESSFASYQHGVFITALSRQLLQRGLDITGPDTVYCDTDSVKYIGDHESEFEALNKELIAEAIAAGAVAKNKKGENIPIGIFDPEPTADLFKTLGAKKYLASYDGGKTIKSTISGVAKNIGKEYFTKHGFEAFTDETTIPVSGKVTARYNNDKPHYIEVNGVKILTASNIALVPAAYTIHIKHDYKDFIASINDKLHNYYNQHEREV